MPSNKETKPIKYVGLLQEKLSMFDQIPIKIFVYNLILSFFVKI